MGGVVSTLKTTKLQHPAAEEPNIVLGADGSVSIAQWDDRARIVNTDANPGRTIYVGSVDPDGVYTLEIGDVWIEVPS
jgi:hypothetical protein